jgi:hypothetical protein
MTGTLARRLAHLGVAAGTTTAGQMILRSLGLA